VGGAVESDSDDEDPDGTPLPPSRIGKRDLLAWFAYEWRRAQQRPLFEPAHAHSHGDAAHPHPEEDAQDAVAARALAARAAAAHDANAIVMPHPPPNTLAQGRGFRAALARRGAAIERAITPMPKRGGLARRLLIKRLYGRLSGGGGAVAAFARDASDEFLLLLLRVAPGHVLDGERPPKKKGALGRLLAALSMRSGPR
jgi:hypothetical protein